MAGVYRHLPFTEAQEYDLRAFETMRAKDRTMVVRKFAVIAGLTAAAIAAPAFAGEETTAKKQRDPNEIVCEKSSVLGSRLATKKVCMTRAQWAELRLQERQEIDKAQVARGQEGN